MSFGIIPNEKTIYEKSYIVLLIISIIHLFISIKYHKIFHVDDGWILSLYYNIVHHGKNISIAAGNSMELVAGYQAYLYEYFILMMNENVYAYRLLSSLFGAVCLFLVYKIVYLQTNSKNISMVCTICISLLELFVQNSHSARTDIMILLFHLLSVYILLQAQNNKTIFLSSFVGALSITIHPLGMISFASMAGIIIHKRYFRLSKIIIYGFLGSIFGLLIGYSNRINYFMNWGDAVNSIQTVRLDFFDFILKNFSLLNISQYHRFYIFILFIIIGFYLFFYRKHNKNIFLFIFLMDLLFYIILGRANDNYFTNIFVFLILFIFSHKKIQFIFVPYIIYHILFWGFVFHKYGSSNSMTYANDLKSNINMCEYKNYLIVGLINDWNTFRSTNFRAYRSSGWPGNWQKELNNYNKVIFLVGANPKDKVDELPKNIINKIKIKKDIIIKNIHSFESGLDGTMGKYHDGTTYVFCCEIFPEKL